MSGIQIRYAKVICLDIFNKQTVHFLSSTGHYIIVYMYMYLYLVAAIARLIVGIVQSENRKLYTFIVKM